jgi:energy-coupling factor transporter ATP-binding protein EcfA2
MFQRLNRELGITVIIVSHDPGIAHMVDRVVRISDGRLASETVRRPISLAGESPASDDQPPDNDFHEHIVLDAAGRLQIPREFLEALDIKGRAMVKLSEDGIIIRPVASDTGLDEAMQLIENNTSQQTRGWLPRLLQQILDRGKKDDTSNAT